MPELPEVETVANGVDARVRGARITAVWTSGKPQTFKTPEAELAHTLTGAGILGVRRVGKTIVMNLRPAASPNTDVPAEFLIHLGMTGRLLVTTPDAPLAPHTHAVLSLADGREIRFVDPRRFGRLSLHQPTAPTAPPRKPLASRSAAPGQSSTATSRHTRKRSRARTVTRSTDPDTATTPTTTPAPGYTSPGREPLTISPQDFAALFRRRKTPIKAALLNQSILTGVGNIYADEALSRASIRPRRQAARLSRVELLRLHAALVDVLARAIQLGGSSVSDYVDADGVRGFFQLEHQVYGRTGQPCGTCATPIKRITVSGRSTHFCPQCQK